MSAKSISTKVSEESYEMVQQICNKIGITSYEIFQNFFDTFIRLYNKNIEASPQIIEAKRLFDKIAVDSINLCETDLKFEVREATYYLNDEARKKNGYRGMLVQRPFFGTSNVSFNDELIAERMFCLLFDKMYKKLRILGQMEECHSVIETVDVLIRHYCKSEKDNINDGDRKFIESMFTDNDRGDFWQKPHDGAPFKRRIKKDIESMPTLFDNTD